MEEKIVVKINDEPTIIVRFGEQGITGTQGDKGDKGDQGDKGNKGDTGDSWLNQDKYNALINNLSTGICHGGILSINGLDNTKFDISAGHGQIVDNSDCENPIITKVSWSAKVGLIDTYRLTDPETFIAIDVNGIVIQETEWFDNEDKRDYIILGTVGHPDLGIIEYVIPETVLAVDTNLQFECFCEALGAFNIEGNDYLANGANLKLNKSAGKTFDSGTNYANSQVHPSIVTTNAETEIDIIYNFTLLGAEWSDLTVSVVNPNQYDTLNGLATVPDGKWTIQTFYQYAPLNYNEMQYGQVYYDSKEDAEAKINAQITIAPLLEFDTFRGWLIVIKGATDLSNPAQAKFIPAGKFGSVQGGAGGGEAGLTTASNVGVGGVGLYLQKSGVDLQFKNINAGSNKITITNDPTNREVDIDVVLSNLPASVLPNDSAVIGTTIKNALETLNNAIVPINAQVGTTYTLVLTDSGKLVTLTNALAIAVTIPTNAVVPFLVGTRIDLLQGGAGKVTFSGVGVTIKSKSSNKSIGAQNVAVSLIKEATDTWYLIGDLIV